LRLQFKHLIGATVKIVGVHEVWEKWNQDASA